MLPHETVEANLREAMRFFSAGTGRGAIETLDGAEAIYSGLNYGVFNIAMLDGPVDSAELPQRLRVCESFYARRGVRWSFWLCENYVEERRARVRDATFGKFGLRRISYAPGMLAERLATPRYSLPKIDVEPVCDAVTREAFGGVTAVAFDIPITVVREVYYPERAWSGSYRGYLAKVQGRVVSIVAIVAAGGVLGVYSLATMPSDRRRGYGEALLREAIARESERTGLSRAILQSTEAAQALYQRLGFREVAQFSVYLTR